MDRRFLWGVLIGVALYFAFLKMRGVIDGAPWAPEPAAGKHRNGS